MKKLFSRVSQFTLSFLLGFFIFALVSASVAITPEEFLEGGHDPILFLMGYENGLPQDSFADFKYAPEDIFSPEVIEPLALPIPEETQCTIPAKIPTQIQDAFDEATQKIPCELLQTLRKIEIFADPEGKFPRALANGRILKIREDAITKPEFVQVLEHELGHVVDLGYLESQEFSTPSGYVDGHVTIYADDPSVDFYSLSWNTDGSKKSNITNLDFVGGYAAGDMFEDFSETFLMYLEHGKEFKILAEDNIILAQKYEFMKNAVFEGREFETGSTHHVHHHERPWDVTKL